MFSLKTFNISRLNTREKDREVFLSNIWLRCRPITIYRYDIGTYLRLLNRIRNIGYQLGSSILGVTSSISKYYDVLSLLLSLSNEELERIRSEPRVYDIGFYKDRKFKVYIYFDQYPKKSDYERLLKFVCSNEDNQNPTRVFFYYTDRIRSENYSSNENDVRYNGYTKDRVLVGYDDYPEDEQNPRNFDKSLEKK